MGEDTVVVNINSYMTYAALPASAILLILVFLQKRPRPNPCGYHIPGIVVPMRFLDGYDERWSYALAFGSITGIIISVFGSMVAPAQPGVTNVFLCRAANTTAGETSICDQVWVKAFSLQVQSLVASLVCAPQFVCITTPYKLVGALMGFAYSVFWIVVYIIGAVKNGQTGIDRTTATLMFLSDLPIVLCFLGLCVRSVWAVYKCYKTKLFKVQRVDNLVEKHQVDHVTSLFRPLPPEPDPPEGLVQRMIVTAKTKAEWFPHFILPTRIICIAFVQLILIYYIAVSMTLFRRILREGMSDIGVTVNTTHDEDTIIAIFDGVYVTSGLVGLLATFAYITLFVINYRKNMVNIYKGKKYLYLDRDSISTAEHVASSLRLPGYQIAYTLWGFIIIFFMLFLFLCLICFGIYFLHQLGLLLRAVFYILQRLSVPLSTILTFYLQVLLVRRLFLQPKINKDDKFHPLNIDNRHLYETVSYTLMFSNLLVGVASALLRGIKSLLLSLIFVARLDRCLLIKGAEFLDPGYMAYVGSLLVDNAHNNPVMRTFCAILVRLTCTPDSKMDKGITHLPEPSNASFNSRARQRWHLAFTLLNNPDLLPRRKLALLIAHGAGDDDNDNDDDNSRSASYGSCRLESVSVKRATGAKKDVPLQCVHEV